MNDSTLYATIAQVLPLFLLALAAERRLGVHERSTDPTIDAVIGMALITSAAIGELSAFAGLTHPTEAAHKAAELGLGFTGLFLFGDLIWSQVAALKAHEPRRASRVTITITAVVIIGMAAALVLLAYLAAYA